MLLLSADFSKINFLEKLVQEHYQSVKLLELRSGPKFKLFASKEFKRHTK